MAGMSVPGNSCNPCAGISASPCLFNLSGLCVYYSGSNLSGPGINTGDNLNTVIVKLSNLVGGTITANNGLTETGSNIQLGGSLLGNTTVTTSTFQMLFDGANTSDAVLRGNNSSTGFGTAGISTNAGGVGVYAANFSSGIALSAESISGISARLSSVSGLPLYMVNLPASTNTITPLIEIHRFSSGTAANGIGGSIDFYNQGNNASEGLSNQLVSKWTDATFATRTSQFVIRGTNSAVTSDLVNISGNGNVGIGQGSPTAVLHLKAGTASAGTAPVKLTAGTLLTTPEDGTLEYDGVHLYFTIGATRHTLV